MTGEDQPSPGISVFQAMFAELLHSVGSPFSLDIPCPVGPRNPGQFSGQADIGRTVRATSKNVSCWSMNVVLSSRVLTAGPMVLLRQCQRYFVFHRTTSSITKSRNRECRL